MVKKNCNKCREEFEEEELDLYAGKWLCNNCEQNIILNKRESDFLLPLENGERQTFIREFIK